jgi:hypothetical protein
MVYTNIFYFMCVVAFTAGRGLLIAASGVGLGMLAFYGMGLSNETGVLENSV